jgi:TM2 domain-containing membrane protein YozV
MWDLILWIAAVVIGILGVLRIVRGDILWGVVLIVVALLVGPGGVSVLT